MASDLEEVMEVEMDEELGRERCQRAAEENASPNYLISRTQTENFISF